jgi:hypothetical protein
MSGETVATLYGHVTSPRVSLGQQISRGMTIADSYGVSPRGCQLDPDCTWHDPYSLNMAHMQFEIIYNMVRDDTPITRETYRTIWNAMQWCDPTD